MSIQLAAGTSVNPMCPADAIECRHHLGVLLSTDAARC
jgi:hypothetical protein